MIIGESHQVLKHYQEGEGGDGSRCTKNEVQKLVVEGKQMVRKHQLQDDD